MGKRDNIIEIKGIVRNTKDSATVDGECDELVGMRMKDGSWRPVGALRIVEGSNGLVGGLQRVWVHRNRYAHVLAINGAGKLCWAGEMDSDGKVVGFSSEVVVDDDVISSVGDVVLTQTGHLVVVKSAEYGMRYYMFRMESNRYDSVAIDFNSVRDYGLLPYGGIDFKVDRVEDEDGRAVWFGNKIEEAGIDAALQDFNPQTGEGNTGEDVMRNVVNKTRESVKRLGLFNGAFLVCTAAELYDGTYILMSKPTLMCAPNYKASGAMGAYNTDMRPASKSYVINNGVYEWSVSGDVCDKLISTMSIYGGGALGVGTVLNDVKATQMSLLQWMHSNRSSSPYGNMGSYFDAAKRGKKEWKYDKELVDDKDFTAYSMDLWYALNHVDVNKRVAEDTQRGGLIPCAFARNIEPAVQMSVFANVEEDTTYCYTNANKLLYKINNLLSKEYRDIIKNISVFATREVDMLDLNGKAWMDMMYEGTSQRNATALWGWQWNYRDSDKVEKELMREPLMYKIGEIGVDLAEADKGKWVELEIEEGVLENLVSQERLKVDSVGRNVFKPRVAFPYNGRLHLANYEERLFEGWLLNDMFHWGGEGQYGFTRKGLPQWVNGGDGYVKVTLEDSEAKRVVVRRIELEKVDGGIQVSVRNPQRPVKLKLKAAWVQSLNCLLSYPDKRAKEIEIYLRDRLAGQTAGANNVFHLKVSLEAHDWYNLAYYINDDFKPIDIIYTERNTGTISVPEEENVGETRANRMKVSRVDNPLFFPNENTYLVGNGEIVGMASNAETLVGGQIGDAPLYVMCSDGVWGMFVDSSGQFTYSNSRIISRYVCNNAQGIRAIMGGVVMPTEWGLVLISGLDSKDVSDTVEGVPMDVSERLPKGWICLNHDRLVKLQGVVEGDFVEFLQSAIIGYNYYEKELWVMGSEWSYVLDNEGHWTKRRETGVQLVEDFPNLYLLRSDGRLMDLQHEDKGDATECMMLTRMMKAQSQEFKQTERLIVRGEFKLGEHHEIAEVVDLRNTVAKVLFERCWVENPTVTTLTENGTVRTIEGVALVEKRLAVVDTDCFVNLQVEGESVYPNWTNVASMRESLNAKSYMWEGTFRRKDWTKVTGASSDYPEFRFDDSGDVWVRFKEGVAFFDQQIGKSSGSSADYANVLYFPDGYEGKYSELYGVVTGGADNNDVLYIHDGVCRGLYAYVKNENNTLTYQDQIASVAAGKNYRVYCTDVAGDANVRSEYMKFNGGSALTNVNCHDFVNLLRNNSSGWGEARKNNSVALVAGNYRSGDGLQFAVSAAQAGNYLYYEIEENVGNGTFGRFNPRLQFYTLSNGSYYRLGANGDVFEFSGGGSYLWSQLQAKVANGDFDMIDVATGSDTVALVNGQYYWFRLKNVVGSESIDVKVKFVGSSGSYTISAIESGLSGSGMFVVITGETVDLSSSRSITLGAGVYRFLYKLNGVEREKVVAVSATTTKSIGGWIDWVSAQAEYVGGERPVVGLYLFGSYDGYRWALVGARERDGEFRDLGLEAHRVDCKYFRLLMCGKLMDGSSVEYIEQEVKERIYEGKIR